MIVPVHRQDEVEVFKVGFFDLPRSQAGQVVAALGSVLLAAHVGRGAGVVVVGAGRVHAALGGQASRVQHVVHHAVRCRAAADVAHAYKKNA
jgi:hypothetical protein